MNKLHIVRLRSLRVRLRLIPVMAGKRLGSSAASQSGAVLIVSLIMLLLLTLIGVTAMQTTSLEEKMAGNLRDKNLAFQAAESALRAAEHNLNLSTVLPTFVLSGPSSTPCPPFSSSSGSCAGFYSAYSTIPTAAAILTDSFWTTNPVATSTVTTAMLGNGIAPPVYIIQKLPPPACLVLPCNPPPVYRITVRATGGSTNTVVILQSIIYKTP